MRRQPAAERASLMTRTSGAVKCVSKIMVWFVKKTCNWSMETDIKLHVGFVVIEWYGNEYFRDTVVKKDIRGNDWGVNVLEGMLNTGYITKMYNGSLKAACLCWGEGEMECWQYRVGKGIHRVGRGGLFWPISYGGNNDVNYVFQICLYNWQILDWMWCT